MSSADDELCDAAERGDVAKIERVIAEGANPNALVDDYTPLQWAAHYGHLAAIAALLKAGAYVDGVDSAGFTPLIMAAWYGHRAAIDALVAAGADVHRANNKGNTALHYASMYGRLDAARVLLEAGAQADVRNKDGLLFGNRPIDVVRCAARSLVAAARLLHAAAPPRRHAQVCANTTETSNEAALRMLLERPPTVKPRTPAPPVAAPAAGGAAFAPAPAPAVDAAAAARERDSLAATLATLQAEVAKLRGEATTRDATIASHVATNAAHVATIAARDATIADHEATIASIRRELDAARSGAAASGAGAAAAPAKPSLVDCELHADAVTFERTRRGDRIRIGKGSFGDVYAATFGDQPCVVKVPHIDGDPATVPAVVQAAFWAEVRTQFLFRHPHIVALHGGYADVDPAAGGVVEVGAVMERCSGGTLEKRLHGGEGGAGAAPGPLKQRLAWGAQVLSALAYLHAKDFIHADLKPENVLLEDGSPGARAKLSDFGLSVKRRDGSATRESLLGFRGSLGYVDSRVLVGGAGGAGDSGSIRKPSDVYSAGVMLWELATVRRPYDKLVYPPEAMAAADLQLAHFVRHVREGGRPGTPAELAALAPTGLGALIGRMWSGRSEDRPTAAAAGEELARLAAGLGDA
jgi:hypothetical protein